jgi:carboxypeptidase C (cathepsin A)
VQFLAKYGRWNSPKYLFGESYGTTRSAVLANLLQTERDVDFNGVILLSQILNFSLDSDFPDVNPGVDIAYQLNLPTYAATAWYHHKLPESHSDLQALVAEVEHFAMNDYALALQAGSALPPINVASSSKSSISTVDCPPPISRRPTCASTAENLRRTCRMTTGSPPVASIRDSPVLLWTR